MRIETLHKAVRIYQGGGVSCGYPGVYAVTSTSGNEYIVNVKTDRCSCPSETTCSHVSAVNIFRSHRRRRLAA